MNGYAVLFVVTKIEVRDLQVTVIKEPIYITQNGEGDLVMTCERQIFENRREPRMIYIDTYISPLGDMTMAGSESGITGLWFDGQKYFGANLPKQYEAEKLPIFEEAKKWLDLYFQGKEPDFTPHIAFSDTEFRMTVWEILLTIPYGQTITYGEIAARVAKEKGIPHMSAQAVGGAVGHNPISIIVPCHRLVGASGSLTGYAGGIDKKIELLKLEKVDVSELVIPKKSTAL